jgi:hypothetical protein
MLTVICRAEVNPLFNPQDVEEEALHRAESSTNSGRQRCDDWQLVLAETRQFGLKRNPLAIGAQELVSR